MQDSKKFFELAYRTGTDNWTHLLYRVVGDLLIEKLPENAMILDVGCGRGLFDFYLAKAGFRVIGIDYIPEVIAKNNEEVKNRGLGKELRFIESDVLDIPFTNSGFAAVSDIGLLQHLPEEDFPAYVKELARVLKSGGYFLNVVFSKETVEFLTWHPKKSKENTFEKDGLHYHFFTKEKVTEVFAKSFEIIEQRVEHFPKHEGLAYVVTLMKKK